MNTRKTIDHEKKTLLSKIIGSIPKLKIVRFLGNITNIVFHFREASQRSQCDFRLFHFQILDLHDPYLIR